MSERQGSRGYVTKTRRLTRHKAVLLLLAAVIFLCLILSGCGSTVDSADSSEELKLVGISKGDLSGMVRILLYITGEGSILDHDAEIIEERVAAYSGGKYAFARTTLLAVGENGVPSGEGAQAVEFYIPKDRFGGELPMNDVRAMISRPIELWIGNDIGTGKDSKFDETVAVRREDIVSAEVMEGCPPGITPFDYGIDAESFVYVQVTLSDSFLAEYPQIRNWDSPCFIQDKDLFDEYFYISAVPSGDGKTFYLLRIPDEEGKYVESSRTVCETIAYDYMHDPLTQGYYIMSIPCVDWESPDPERATYQIGADDFETISYVYTYKMEETVCTDEDWETAKQAVRDRLEALGLHFAMGEADIEGRALVVRVEYRPVMWYLMEDLIMTNPRVNLCSLSERIRIWPGDAHASVLKQDDRYTLAIDMSDVKKDTINKLTNLSWDQQGDRIFLEIGGWLTDFPLAMTDYDKVIRDGQITLDQSVMTGETGFAEKDRAYLDLAACIINGSNFPAESNGEQRVTLKDADIANLDAKGRFCFILSEDELDCSVYYDKLKRKAVKFSPQGTGKLSGTDQPGPTMFILQFAMPPEEARAERIAESAADMIRVFKDDIFMIGVGFEWVGENGRKIRVACNGATDTPDKMNISVLGYHGVSQEDLDAVLGALEEQDSLKGKLDVYYVGPAD